MLEAVMQVREMMSNHVVCCTPDTNLRDVARLMTEHDCGDIPVIQVLREVSRQTSAPSRVSA
jgi:CBS domain-containing protein